MGNTEINYDRDIRSPSMSRLRQSSIRAKYGANRPPKDAFIRTDDFHVRLGGPIGSLTAAEKFAVAHRSVERLIGIRVIRHNQRTGERDPWRYYGAGRRWAKKIAQGRDVDVREEGDMLQGEADAKYEQSAGRRVILDSNRHPETFDIDPESHEQPVPGSMADPRGTAKEKNPAPTDAIGTWEVVGPPEEQHSRDEDDDWDIISTTSCP